MLDNLKKYRIILASNSPRRKDLLSGLGVDYEVRTLPDVDESYPDTLQGGDIPLYIAREKAAAYCNLLRPDELMITEIPSFGWTDVCWASPVTVKTLCRCCATCRDGRMKSLPVYALPQPPGNAVLCHRLRCASLP